MLVVRAEISEGAAESMARGLIDYGDGGSINERALAAALASTPAGADSGPPVVAPDPGVTPPPGAAPTRTSTRSTVSPTPSTSASSEPKR
jgi:hypothetical protein